MHRFSWIVMAAALAFAAPAVAQDATPPVDWHAAAMQDIEAAYQVYRDNHPGWDDPTNPDFRAQLEKAREAGLARAERAASAGGYVMALGAFNEVLGDGHATLYSEADRGSADKPLAWPGFVPAWRAGEAVVHSTGAGFDLPVGSRIASCDGRPIREVFRERGVAIGFRPTEEGRWWFRVPSLMMSSADDPIRPASCTFVGPDGVTVNETLTWPPAPADFDKPRNDASDGEWRPVGLTGPVDGIYWIALQTFGPDEAGRAAYKKLYADIAAQHDALAKARAVVLDLRNNNGGSSQWPLDVARALWGAEAVDRRAFDATSGVAVWYRASAANAAYMDELLDYVKDNPEAVEYFGAIREGMKAALAKGEPYFTVADTDEDIAAAKAKSPLTDFVTPVYVITPGRCASACLDAVDTFTLFDNVTLIGAPTSADTTYMEIRRQDLPSGQGKMSIPIKFYHGRPRESGQAYHPRIRIDDLDWSSETFVNAIERDLGGK